MITFVQNRNMATYNINNIWGNLFSSKQRCLDSVKRLQIETNNGNLGVEQYKTLLTDRLNNSRTSEPYRKECKIRLSKLNGTFSNVEPGEPKKKKVKSSLRFYEISLNELARFINAVSNFVNSDNFPFVALVGALCFQVRNLTTVIQKADETAYYGVCLSFAVFAEITGLLMTIHHTKKSETSSWFQNNWILILFAVFQVWIDLIAFFDWNPAFSKITIAFFLGFCIFSYSEIYVNIKNSKI